MTVLEFETLVEDPEFDLSPAEREALARNLRELLDLRLFDAGQGRRLVEAAIVARDYNRRSGLSFSAACAVYAGS